MKKEYKKGKWLLTHERYIDDMGFERDAFDLFDTEKRVHRPFTGFPKVSNLTKDSPINLLGYDYTEKDYEEMINEQISLIK